MAFFTGWLGKIGGADGGATLIGDLLRMRAIVLANLDDTIDILRSNGAGAALVSVVDGATSALQTAANALLGSIAPGSSTVLVDISANDWAATGSVPFTLIIGTAGACKVTDDNGHDTVIPAMPAGYVHPGLVTLVWKVGTAATNMVAVY